MFAPSTGVTVRAAGGWMFDHVMEGWNILALVVNLTDSRPLRILGVRAVDMDDALSSPLSGPSPHTLAVDADLYESDVRVQERVSRAIGHGADVWLWGMTESSHGGDSVRHQLSLAARAFKTQALMAAAVPADGVGAHEVFRCGASLSLIPAG